MLWSYYGTDLIYTIAHYSMLFPTIGWPITSALAANLAYLYTLPLCTFFSSLYYNVVIQSILLQHCNSWGVLNLVLALLLNAATAIKI